MLRRGLGLGLLVVLLVVLLAASSVPARAELSSADWKKAADRAEQATRKADEKEAAAAIAAAAADDSERAAKLIAQVVSKFPAAHDDFFDQVYGALEKLKAPAALAELRKLVAGGTKDGAKDGAKDWRLRVLVVDVLGMRGKGEQEAIAKALDDKQEEVVRAATRQLGRLRTAAGIAAICDAMAKLEGKGKTAATWQDMRNALMRALGVDLQGGADYKNYLEANKDRFVEGQGIAPDPSKAKARADSGGGRVGETVVFGTELYCKNVVLIIDVSGSMEMTDPYPPGMDLGSKDRKYIESNGMLDPERKRITRARNELTKLLDALAKAKGKINIITFSTQVDCWKKDGLVELTSEHLRGAKAFVKDIKADGVTCTESALEVAFAVAPQADCFYLFSDGKATNDGEHVIPAKEIIDAVDRLNKVRKVQVNTFGFIPPAGVEGADVELMSGLAEHTGGTYTEIR